jgi:hypothetical protein
MAHRSDRDVAKNRVGERVAHLSVEKSFYHAAIARPTADAKEPTS